MLKRATAKVEQNTSMLTVGVRSLVIFIVGLMSVIPSGSPRVASAAESGYVLQVKPRVCVTLSSDSPCAMELEVSWSAPILSDVCLKLTDAETSLHCWQQQRAGEFAVALERDKNATLQLLDAALVTVFNEVEISVVSRDLRDTRRRRRHAWSIL